jgi:enterochelin esterase-like enzyme
MLYSLLFAVALNPQLAADEPPQAAALVERFNREKSPVWADGDIATFFFRGEAERVELLAAGEIKALERIPSSDVWTLTSTYPGLERAVISYMIAPKREPGAAERPQRAPQESVWRGPKAPPQAARAADLRGSLKTIEIESSALAAQRKLTVYFPPGFEPGRVKGVIYAADGESIERYAPFLEPLITSGKIPPVLLVGVHSGGYIGGAPEFKNYDAKKDMRVQEYFPGINEELFAKHETFFCSEVTSYSQREWKVSSHAKDRALFGCSNGGRFVFEMAMRHPDEFGNVLAFSVPGAGEIALPPSLKTAARFYLEVGTWEREFETYTKRLAAALERAGFQAEFRSRAGGHDEAIWREEFARALVLAFGSG